MPNNLSSENPVGWFQKLYKVKEQGSQTHSRKQVFFMSLGFVKCNSDL